VSYWLELQQHNMQCLEGESLSRNGGRVILQPPLSGAYLSKAAKVDFQVQCDMSTAVEADLCCRGVL